jgi:hypothetical protein
VEPVVQTMEVIADLDLEDDGDLLHLLRGQSRQMHALVPDVVGMSVGNVEHGLTLTWAATDAELAVLDLRPHLADGGGRDEARRAAWPDPGCHGDRSHVLDERCWRRFARATAAEAVAATLTLPVLHDGLVISSVDLYAGSWDAFDGRHEDIAFVFGAWAPGAVINADLAFSTRDEARQGPVRLRASLRIHLAVGIIASSTGLDPEAARTELRNAAARAGLTEGAHAEVVIRRAEGGHPA